MHFFVSISTLVKFCKDIGNVRIGDFREGCVSSISSYFTQDDAFKGARVMAAIANNILVSVREFRMRFGRDHPGVIYFNLVEVEIKECCLCLRNCPSNFYVGIEMIKFFQKVH